MTCRISQTAKPAAVWILILSINSKRLNALCSWLADACGASPADYLAYAVSTSSIMQCMHIESVSCDNCADVHIHDFENGATVESEGEIIKWCTGCDATMDSDGGIVE
jgi:hypothetical protein